MAKVRKTDLDRRLEAHFATLRPDALRQALKRSVGHWQMYAAVGGSALAMTTGASASLISAGSPLEPQAASVRAAMPSPSDIRFAIASRYAGQGFLHGIRLPRRTLDTVNPRQRPSIATDGVRPFYGTTSVIEPGEWVSIYGQNLAATTASWNFDFPTSLAGTSVTINGKAAFLSHVSPDQINLQAPDDLARGPVSVVVTTAAGTATSTVTLSDFAPSFILLQNNFVSGIILKSDGSGAFGGGTYDVLGPTGDSFGYPTMSARTGDIVELFGVGFGPTTPIVPAGASFLGTAPVNTPVSLYINNVPIHPTFVGLSSAGLYQINLVVPERLGEGAVAIRLEVGGMQAQTGVLFPLHDRPPILTGTGGGTYVGTGSTGGGFVSAGSSGGTMGGGTMGGGSMGGTGGGTGGGSGAGSGGGGGSGGGTAAIRKPYQPKLQFGTAETKVTDA